LQRSTYHERLRMQNDAERQPSIPLCLPLGLMLALVLDVLALMLLL
jgi:hypothetical protein